MLSFDYNKVKFNFLIHILCFFIGVYSASYILSINYISFPIDYWCSPPFDFASEHWSPKDWKRYAIPYWDQIPDSFESRTKPNTQSKCFQFTVIQNTINSTKDIEIKYSIDYIIPCQYGWYFSHQEISIISQLELVCNKSWKLVLFPIIFSVGFILSLFVLKLEHYMIILYATITLMLGSSLVVCMVTDFKIFIALRFLTAFCFGANFLLSILLIEKLNIAKSYENILLSAILGWISAKGLIPQIIWLLKDWKIVHILMSFSVMPVILFGVILFKMQLNESVKNMKYIEEDEENYNELKVNPIKATLSDKLLFAIVLTASLIYFAENSLLHKKAEVFSKKTFNSFIMTSILQFFAILTTFIAKRKLSICFILLISLLITCVCNLWFSYLGLFGGNFNDIVIEIFDKINKIGVSATFYTNLIIIIDNIKAKTPRFNFFLLVIIIVCYGISSVTAEFDFISSALRSICFSTAILILIAWLLNERLQIYQHYIEKTGRNEKVFYLKNDTNDDKFCIINDSQFVEK